MKILMLTRLNFHELDGGDKIQLLKTKAGLEKLGHQVDVFAQFVKDLRGYDVIHLFNIQINPDIFLLYLIYAQRRNKPVALSTIYWNPKQWKTAVSSEAAKSAMPAISAKQATTRAAIPRYLVFWYLISSAAFRKRWLLGMQGDKEKTAHFIKQYLVNHADIILPNGRSELELINKDFGKPKAAAVIPNGVDALFQNSRADEFTNQYKVEGFVLSVGRIESRKNTLALAKACNALGRRLVLIGNDEHEANYVTAVEQAGGDLLTIIPQMPHQKLGSAYKAAKVHALVSWFETPGLSSLEAAVAGCNIVSTSIGTTKEYFGDMAWYCNPADQTSIEKALKSAFETPRSTKLQQHVLREFSWQHVAQLTAAVYEKIIG